MSPVPTAMCPTPNLLLSQLAAAATEVGVSGAELKVRRGTSFLTNFIRLVISEPYDKANHPSPQDQKQTEVKRKGCISAPSLSPYTQRSAQPPPQSLRSIPQQTICSHYSSPCALPNRRQDCNITMPGRE